MYINKTQIMVKQFFAKHYLKILGSTLGATGGFLYYYFVGCQSGSCPITSNPYISIIYGALMGYLLFDLFKTKGNKTDGNN